MKKLIQLDKLDGNRKGVLRKITEEGQIITNLITTFPAKEIAKPEIFPSLLFYYGMLTITATRGSRLVLSIPNYNVRKQYYEFMLEEYQDKRHINLNNLMDLFDEMAYEAIGAKHWNSLPMPTRKIHLYAVPWKASEIYRVSSPPTSA